MPTYEYECQKCGHRFDAFQSIKDAPLRKCPRCGSKVKRLVSGGAGFLFKGSGFYQTDYRSESYRKRAREEAGGAKGEGKGEGKGAGKGVGESAGAPGGAGAAKKPAAAKKKGSA